MLCLQVVPLSWCMLVKWEDNIKCTMIGVINFYRPLLMFTLEKFPTNSQGRIMALAKSPQTWLLVWGRMWTIVSGSRVKHKQASLTPSALKQAEGNLGIQRMKQDSRSSCKFQDFLCDESSPPPRKVSEKETGRLYTEACTAAELITSIRRALFELRHECEQHFFTRPSLENRGWYHLV